MSVTLSKFAREVQPENAFTVLSAARQLQAAGKDVIELEIGDSPFPSTTHAVAAGIEAIRSGQTHYCASSGLPELREVASRAVDDRFDLTTTAEHIVVGPGAKTFQQLFCEAFLEPGDGVLVFGPYFPTYPPNIARRGARMYVVPLLEEEEFRPNPQQVAKFLEQDPRPKAIFLNSPHNPTGGVATEDDLRAIADIIRGRDVVVFSDEPYEHMVWRGRHHTLLAQPDMLEQCVSAYTFSKSYSMSGWRVGYAVSSPSICQTFGTLINTALSCVPPLAQFAAAAALTGDSEERDRNMRAFGEKVAALAAGLDRIPGIRCRPPAGTFYVFPNVTEICNRHRITSHGLAMYLLEGADDKQGVACLGGECFGKEGHGYLRFSCAEPSERIEQALELIARAVENSDRIGKYLGAHPRYRLV